MFVRRGYECIWGLFPKGRLAKHFMRLDIQDEEGVTREKRGRCREGRREGKN